MKLKIQWSEFESAINQFLDKGIAISQQLRQANDVEASNQIIESWGAEVYAFLKDVITEDSISIAHDFNRIKYRASSNTGMQLENDTLMRAVKDTLNQKLQTLQFNSRIIGSFDSVTSPDLDISERKQFSTNQSIALLLRKLYELYDDYKYPVALILKGNGIELKRMHEDREIVTSLVDRGWVEQSSGFQIGAQLTVEGRLWVEENLLPQKLNYEQIDQSNLAEKLDQIAEKLRELGFGQEVLFNEIDSLKEYSKSMDKKSWGQLLVMKMAELTTDRVIDKVLASKIVQELTDQVLRIG